MSILFLFLQFAKFGALAFGGGFTILPLLFDTFVEKAHTFSATEFGNLISISQMTPGPVTINIATFTGYLEAGILGSIIASLGTVFPSLIITGIALFFLNRYQNSWVVQGFLKGAHLVAFTMLLYAAVLFCNMSILSEPWSIKDILKSITSGHFVGPKDYHINWPELGVFIVSFYCTRRSVPATKLLIIAAIFGCFLSFL